MNNTIDVASAIKDNLDHNKPVLDLSNTGLKRIPEKINELTHLKYLYLSKNSISKIENLNNLNNLDYLDLSNNILSSINGVEELINLKKLDLSYNVISKLTGRIKSLYSLEILRLDYNNIQYTDNLLNLKNLQNLITLSLNGNQLQELKIFEDEKFLINLEELFIQYNKLIFLTINFSKLQRIKLVNLCYNNSLFSEKSLTSNLHIVDGNNMITQDFIKAISLFFTTE